MTPSRVAVWAVALLLAGTPVLAGPAVGVVDLTQRSQEFGDGDATVSDVSLREAPSVSAGRFGTERDYFRGPSVTATVREVTGTPRLVLRVEAPAMGVDETTTRLLQRGERGDTRLSIPDVPLAEAPDGTTEVRTTVRVQSFDGDRTVFTRNLTVGGDR